MHQDGGRPCIGMDIQNGLGWQGAWSSSGSGSSGSGKSSGRIVRVVKLVKVVKMVKGVQVQFIRMVGSHRLTPRPPAGITTVRALKKLFPSAVLDIKDNHGHT
eukprot:2778352-Karenia_brevis.AAC.1